MTTPNSPTPTSLPPTIARQRANAAIQRPAAGQSDLGHFDAAPPSRETIAYLARELDNTALAQTQIPATWRAAVADLAQLLRIARETMERWEHTNGGDSREATADERHLIEQVEAAWGPAYRERISTLWSHSQQLSKSQQELARAYATRELLPLLRACPMHARIHDKPRGYAGDYIMMLMFLSEDYEASSLYGRFLHYVCQRYTLSHAVVRRAERVQAAIQRACAGATDRECKIVSFACGPAAEIAAYLRAHRDSCPRLRIIITDQDRDALACAVDALQRAVAECELSESVQIVPLELSVVQLIKPSETTRELLEGTLSNVDLVYTSGLLDYFRPSFAHAILGALYDRLRPGGHLLAGNLREAADSTWLMEYVLDWDLEYRDVDDMVKLGQTLLPRPAQVSTELDASQHCVFVDVTRPE